MPDSASFHPELFQFLRQLRRHNDREWVAKNKARYQCVLEPALLFIGSFAPHLAKLCPFFLADPRPTRGSLFRIYRDTRFSPDKRPFKTHVGMRFSHSSGKDAHAPVFYLHLEPENCFAAAGVWHPDNRALTRIRTAIVDQPERWANVRRKLELEGGEPHAACFASCHACAIRSRRLGPIPSTDSSSATRLSITPKTSAPNRPTSLFASTGPIPLTKPLPRYRPIPSAVVGGTVFMVVALNWSPCSLSLTHQPSAVSHSPAATEGSDPRTVASSRCPRALTRSTQKPLSSLWKVTRSIRPEISSVTGLRSGIAAFIWMAGLIESARRHIPLAPN
jgi:hypothetical protein